MLSWRANIFLIFFAAVLVTTPIIMFGVPKGNDLPQHFQFALVFRDSLAHGVLYPSWAPNVNSGFGDVGVRFYPPLAYFLLVLFYAVFSNWVYATAATICLMFFVGGTGVYFWCREWFRPRASLIGGMMYVLVPYHVNEVYNAFTFAELAAACFLPFCFLYVIRVIKRGKIVDIIGLAVSFAALILTHLPMAVLGSISLALFALALLWRNARIGNIARLLAAFGLGLVLSAFYWVRMVSELPFVNHTGKSFISGDYDFRNNFVWSFFYTSADQYSERSLGFLDLMLLVTLAMAIAAIVVFYLRAKRSKRGPINALLTVLAASLFFATPLSSPIWDRIGLLQRTQFPWRWMAIISLVCCVAVAAGVDQLRDLRNPKIQRLALVLGGLAAATITFSVAQVIRPAIFLEPTSFDKTVAALSTADSCDCWWPIWAKKEALADPAKVTSGARSITIETWQPTYRVFQVSADNEEPARVATFYYPNWHGRVNGQEAQIGHDDNGAILIQLPMEDSHVELYFVEPRLIWMATFISIAAWVCLVAFGVYRVIKTKRSGL
ncbi:MAG TPA: 6-pyruvoyl-tetrahydropterin synthase-related protein, partial [Pyrinomonadaceae bacterium]